MVNERQVILSRVKASVGGRPVRWTDDRTCRGDFEGREWTLELFDIPREEQRQLHRGFSELRKRFWQATGHSLTFIFHTPEATERHYAWVRHEELSLVDSALREVPPRRPLRDNSNTALMTRRVIPATLPRAA